MTRREPLDDPQEPIERIAERVAEGDAASRRQFLRRMGAAGLVAGAGSLLAGCGGIEGTGATTPQGGAGAVPVADHPQEDFDRLVVSNWPLYIDERTPKTWEKRFDARLRYIEDINDNESFYAKVRGDLEQGNSIGRDIVILTDWMAARWIRAGYLEPIDTFNVPNRANLVPSLRHPAWDPHRMYTMPWQSGMTGIGYNPKLTGGRLQDANDLFDPKFKGRVTFLSEWRDSAALVMLADGVDITKATIDDVMAAIEKMGEAAASGQIRRFTGNDYAKDLASGNVWACIAWSGDIVQLQADNPDLEFLIPESGALIWSDNMMIPKGGNAYAAETWMNFYYEPAIAAELAAYVNYFVPVMGAKEEAEKIDPGLAANQLIFPDEETQKRLFPLGDFTPEEERQATVRMQEITGAG
ncbi:MAG: spermidine/putrescine ABC transporter substrate-binding protein [Solirubrobacteraceae bacterium]|nr:spermidine/putrescine ABC transporter substrate-binding protein [Solirubrobacteraceae bacterium]